jgi:hypothetical protein
MKRIMTIVAGVLVSAAAGAQTVSVQAVQGDVNVRHGVTEQWTTVARGDVLRPDDSMKTGPRGSAVLAAGGVVQKRITLPANVMVDVADIRELTPEELMLKLTMEKVRGSSYRSSDDLQAPNAAVVHGANRGAQAPLPENDPASGVQEWNGARVLFDNGFYSTCALKGMELFRLYPDTRGSFDRRFMVARALELARLRGEALDEYTALQTLEGLTPAQHATLTAHINQTRGQTRGQATGQTEGLVHP